MPLGLAVALFFVINVLIPGYANLNSLLSLLLLSSLLGIAAVGQTLTIVIGGFDLSIPAIIGLCNVLFSLLYGAGWSALAAILFILALSTLIGLANGFASRYLQLNPLVVTLASGSIIFGAIWAGTHGEVAGSVPDWLVTMVSVIGKTGPIPLPGAVVLWVVVSAAILFLEQRTVLGRWIFAAGANPRAAELARVPMLFVWMSVYGISAFLAGVAGISLRDSAAQLIRPWGPPTSSRPSPPWSLAARRSRAGAAATAARLRELVVTELSTLLVGLGLNQAAQQIFLGFLIVALVALYGREPHVSMRV